MNFKPTLLKSIISVLAGIVTNYYPTTKAHIYCIKAPCPQPTWLDYAFTPRLLIASIIVMILTYTIWSLFQEKEGS